MQRKLQEIVNRYGELQRMVMDPALIQDQKRYREVMQENAQLAEIVEEYIKFNRVNEEIAGTRELIDRGGEQELLELAKEELKELENKKVELDQKLKICATRGGPTGSSGCR